MSALRAAAEGLTDQDEATGLNLPARWVRFSAEQLAEDPPEKEFIWESRVPLGDVGVLAAQGGSGKTALLTGLAIHRATGTPFLGRGVRQGSTVIVTTEDGAEDYLRKIAAWRTWLPHMDLEAVAEHVHVVDLAGVPFRLIRSQFGDYVPTDHVRMLTDAVKTRAPGADLIVIETVSRVGGDEGNAAMSALICAAEEVAKNTPASVLLVAHTSKAAAREKIGDAYAARGGSAIADNGRYTLTLTGIDGEGAADLLPGVSIPPQQLKELSILRVPKINAAPKQDPIVLQTIPTRWGLVLREYEVGRVESAEERRHSARRALGNGLRAMAVRLVGLHDPLTTSKLNQGLYKDVPGLSKQRIASAVADAIEDGFIQSVPRTGRGGGNALVPGEKQERSAEGQF